MSDNITIIGNVASEPRRGTSTSGVEFFSMRVATSERRLNRESGEWSDGPPNFYTVSAYRQLAENAYASLRRGDRVVVAGRVRIRSYGEGDKRGTSVDIDAEAIGPELRWGTTTFHRNRPSDTHSSDEWAVPGEDRRVSEADEQKQHEADQSTSVEASGSVEEMPDDLSGSSRVSVAEHTGDEMVSVPF